MTDERHMKETTMDRRIDTDTEATAGRSRRRRLRSLVDLQCLELRTLAAELRYIESTLADESGDPHYGALTGLDGFKRRLERMIHTLERARGNNDDLHVSARDPSQERELEELLSQELLGGLIDSYRARVVGLACATREARELGSCGAAENLLEPLRRLERDLSLLSGTLAG